MKKWSLILLCAGLAFACTACSSISMITGETYADADKYSAQSCFSVSKADVDRLVISWNSGKVSLVQTDADAAEITASENGSLAEDAKMHWRLDGRTLIIRFCASGYSGVIHSEDKHLSVAIPAGLDAEISTTSAEVSMVEHSFHRLDVTTTSGSISAAGITAQEELRIGTVSGRIQIGDILAPKGMSAGSTSGSVSVDRLNASAGCTFSTVSGAVTVKGVHAPGLEISGVSGKAAVELSECDSLRAGTVSGSTNLTLTDGLGAELHFGTVSGTFNAKNGYSVTADGRNVIGDGHCAVQVSSTSGGFTVEQR